MRDAVVGRELEHFRIDHDEPAPLGLHPVHEREDHGVDRHRLARAGGAGDQEVRHAGEVDDHRLAADRLAERDGQPMLRVLEIRAGEKLAQVDRLPALVRQFDADGVAALDHGHAGRDGRHRAGDIVGEPDHPRRFDSRGRLELIERDDRAGTHVDDLPLDAEIVEDALEQARILLQRVLRNPRPGGFFWLGQHGDRGHHPVAPRWREPGLDGGTVRAPRRHGRKDDGRRANGHGRGRALRAGSVRGRIGQGVVDVAEI
jgi:hypothetical protein